ncbi:MAG: SPFH domain-containing protein [Oscillospiraceae bacterium]|nr:SPFH domain-containing protein [Oscillospiraceae bacterium]
MFNDLIIMICVFAFLFFAIFIAFLSRYKKCPSDKILVVYGKLGHDKDGNERSSKCIHGGATFVWPVIQDYKFLDLTPMSISVDLRGALSKQNIRIDVPSRFTVGISTEPGIMQNAAERLLGLSLNEVQELTKDIILGQLRLVIATMSIEEINTDRDRFLEEVSNNVETELKKIGLRLINVNVTDINDESGYIQALGREAAAKAINDAKRMVALREKEGSIGEADAKRDQRIAVSLADSNAISGENEAKMKIADSDAQRREREAEALKRATTAEKIQKALSDAESFEAQRNAELKRAELEKATLEADVIIKVNIDKQQLEIQAEAEAEQARIRAKGEADATLARLTAEAEGNKEILIQQAEGFAKIVEAAGGDVKSAIQLLIADKIDELVKIQVEAISNLKIDKVTVWDSMGTDGQTPATANFLSGMLKSVPPLSEMFKMAGMEIPQYLGSNINEENANENIS